MSTRQELIGKIDELTEGDDAVMDVVNDFINEIESKFSEISTLLDGVSICTLDNIEDAKNIADNMGTSLY